MNQPLYKLKKEAQALKLSATEKAALHAALMRAMKESDADAAAPRLTPSPFFFAPQFAGAFAALLVVVLGGTAYAAEGALPGDLLYGIKTQVSEPIEGVLSFSTESKIQFYSGVAQARLEEAEALAAQNRLDASTTQELQTSIVSNLSERDELAAKLDEKSPGASVSVVGELNSSIAAHGEVLAALGSSSTSTTTRENSDALALAAHSGYSWHGAHAAASAKSAAPALMMAPAAEPKAAATMMLTAEGSSSSSSSSDASTSIQDENKNDDRGYGNNHGDSSRQGDAQAAMRLEARATTSLAMLAKSAEAARPSLKGSVAQKLDTRLGEISSLVAAGEDALATKDYSSAEDNFSLALQKSVALSTFIAANKKFDGGILGRLLDGNSQDDGE